MKKFLAMMLAVLMLLSMATVAFADGEKTITPSTFDVKLSVVRSGIPSADYVFTFTAADTTPSGYETAVTTSQTQTLTNIGEGNTYKVTFDMPTFTKPGKYLYKVTMTDPGIKGASADKLVCNVIMNVTNADGGYAVQVSMYPASVTNPTDKDKTEGFVYTYKTAQLTITKAVNTEALEAAKANKYEFTYTISGLNAGETYDYTVVGEAKTATASTEGIINGAAEIADNESIIFTNLPVGANYSVSENENYKDGNGFFTGKWDVVEGVEVVPTSKTLGENGATHTMTNTFTYNNTLNVKKLITGTGSYDDASNPFKVKVTITGMAEGKSYTMKNGTTDVKEATVNDEGKLIFDDVAIRDGETLSIAGLPQNVSFTVEETNAQGYDATYVNTADPTKKETGSISGNITNADVTIEITNNKDVPIETGVALDTLPYVLVLALAGAGLVMMIARKRRVED